MSLQKTTERQNNELFPVFLKLNQLHTLLVGAGKVGLEKLTAVLKNSPEAKVTIVAETISDDVRVFAADFPKVAIHERPYASEDLAHVDLAIIATGNAHLNQQIREQAEAQRILINVADKPELCDFYLGSIVQKGNLKIGISTNGKSPTVAKRLKEILSDALPHELEEALLNMNKVRDMLKGDFAFKVQKLNEITQLLIETEDPSALSKDQD